MVFSPSPSVAIGEKTSVHIVLSGVSVQSRVGAMPLWSCIIGARRVGKEDLRYKILRSVQGPIS